MADQQQHAPGGHYSGKNKIPNIKEFVTNLDKEKAERDKRIDEQAKKREAARNGQAPAQQDPNSDAREHQVVSGGIKDTQKQVRDPTSGRQVVIEDVNKETMNNVRDPQV